MTYNSEYTIIGIDGGGTHTRGILVKDGKIAAQSKAGTTRIGAVGVGESSERILNIIADLCEQAAIDSEELDMVVIGLAGVWLEEEKKRSTQLIKTLGRSQKMILNDLIVISDAELAIEGAFEGEQGIVLIVGTGSIAVGKADKNKIVRCGGWGIELDDEGSGAWIGREGLTAVVRSLDGRGQSTTLTDFIADINPSIDIAQPRTIVKAYAERAFEYQMLSPSVMRCAEAGDVVCMDIVKRAGDHLLEHLFALHSNYKISPIPVALMGGIIDAETILADQIIKGIKKDKRFKRVEPKGTALNGAVSIAYRVIEEMDS